jgi:hypothetical protein
MNSTLSRHDELDRGGLNSYLEQIEQRLAE